MRERPNYLPADERRGATVEAVVALAARQNPSEITTTAIAQHMGLTQGALFRHFPTKDAILQAVLSWVAERLLARVDRAAEDASSALAALEGRRACLLGHHGMIAIGATLSQALDVAIEIEFLADLYLRLLPLGEPPVLPDSEMAVVLEKFKGYGANAQKK